MKDRVRGQIVVSCSLVALALLLTTSCSKLDAIEQQTHKTQDQLDKTQDRLGQIEQRLDQAGTGRYQIVVASQTDRATILFLIDTRTGETSVYRWPQGPAINGYWSNIPRLTYSDEYWQRAFTQGQQPAPGATTQPSAAQPAPTTTQK